MTVTWQESAALLRASSRERPVQGELGTNRVRVDGDFAWVKEFVENMRDGGEYAI